MAKHEHKAPSVIRLIMKPLIFLVVPFLVVLSIMPGPEGKSVFLLTSLLPSSDTLSAIAPALGIDGLLDDGQITMPPLPSLDKPFMKKEETIYKWQDSQGQWHFSEFVPPEAQDTAVAMKVSNKVNTMAAPEIRQTISSSTSNNDDISLPTEVNLKDLPKLMENAKNVQHVLNKRAEDIGNKY